MFGLIFIITAIVLQVNSGLITHSDDGHQKATSYQSFDMEHFHAVPTHVKKEYKHLLEHPISLGKSSANIKVQHGDKHDYGYAIVDLHNTLNAKEEPKHEEENAKYVYYVPKENEKEEQHQQQQQYEVADNQQHYEAVNSQQNYEAAKSLEHYEAPNSQQHYEVPSNQQVYEEPKAEKLVAQEEKGDTSQSDAYHQLLHHYAIAQSAQAEEHHEEQQQMPVALALHGVNYGQDDKQLSQNYYQPPPQIHYEYYQQQVQSQNDHTS